MYTTSRTRTDSGMSPEAEHNEDTLEIIVPTKIHIRHTNSVFQDDNQYTIVDVKNNLSFITHITFVQVISHTVVEVSHCAHTGPASRAYAIPVNGDVTALTRQRYVVVHAVERVHGAAG